ncbi:MAG: hypothetical protein M9949_09795 [Candidatus Kapabacteria bacterium]|nr:hypothetical protein [Candidatus Kapabacteria bacterium]
MRDVMLIVHFIGLAMGIGTSFAFMFLGIASAKMEKSEALKFSINSLALSRMGHIGLALLIVSGGYLMTPYWSVLSTMPLLMAKLGFVLVLILLIVILSMYAKKAKKGDAETYLNKIEPLGKISLLVGLTIIVLAVYVFH